jgi:hypothetical protein
MRPEKAYNLINSAFRRGGFYCNKTEDKSLIDFKYHFNTPKIKRALKCRLKYLINSEKRIDKEWGIEYEETQAHYDADLNKLSGNLHYISDRWNCVGRIKYIINLLELVNKYE